MRWLGEEVASSKPVIISEASQAKAAWLAPAVGVSHAHVAQILRIVRPVAAAELPLEEGDQVPDSVVVAELVAGRTLAQALINTALPPYQAVRCAAYIASALDALHRRGAAHGALSPRSVVLERADEGASPVLTQLAEAPHVGFASPERLRGSGPSQQDDVWALHALLYSALTGRVPFRGKDAQAVLEAQSIARPNPLASFGVNDVTLQYVIEVGLHPDPDHRTRRVVDVEGELFNWLTANSPSQLAMRAIRRGSEPGRVAPVTSAPPAAAPKTSTVTPLPRERLSPRSATLRYGVQVAPPPVPSPPPPPISEAPAAIAGAPRIPDLDVAAAPPLPPPPAPPSSRPPPEARSPSAVPELASALIRPNATRPKPPLPKRPEQQRALPPAPPPPAQRPVLPAPVDPAPTPSPEIAAPTVARTPHPMTSSPEIVIAEEEATLETVLEEILEPDIFSELGEAATAPLPPAPLPPAPSPAPAVAHESTAATRPLHPISSFKQAPKRSNISMWVLAAAGVGVAAIAGTAAVVGVMLFASPSNDIPHTQPAATAPPAPSRSLATTSPVITTGPRVAAPPASTPAAPPPETPPPSASPAQVTRCVSEYFPPETFDGLQDLSFVCDEAAPKRGCAVMRRRIVMGSRGHVTKGMNEWSRLAWHELAVYAILRQACCPSPGPIELPPPVQSCKAVGTMADNLAAAFVKNASDFDDRLLEFHRAADCAHYTNAPGYKYPAGPISGGQIVFDEFLKRNRARLHGG